MSELFNILNKNQTSSVDSVVKNRLRKRMNLNFNNLNQNEVKVIKDVVSISEESTKEKGEDNAPIKPTIIYSNIIKSRSNSSDELSQVDITDALLDLDEIESAEVIYVDGGKKITVKDELQEIKNDTEMLTNIQQAQLHSLNIEYHNTIQASAETESMSPQQKDVNVNVYDLLLGFYG